MSARQSPCFTCLKGVAKLIKFRQNGHISMLFFSFWGDRGGVSGAYGSPRNRRKRKEKKPPCGAFPFRHARQGGSFRQECQDAAFSHSLFTFYFFTFLPFKIVNTCGRVPTSGAASWVSTRGNGSLCSSRFLPRRSRRTSPIALPCCRRLRGRCPELPALPL